MQQEAKDVGAVYSEVCRVALKTPDYIPDDPELWFLIMDRGFQNAGITADDTKFGYVMTALPKNVLTEVRDVLTSPPAVDKYETLRATVLKRLGATKEQKIRQLMELEEMGDRKPSQYLRRLKLLAGNSVDEGVLRTIWMSRMPTHIQAALLSRRESSLEETAETADTILDVTGNTMPAPRVSSGQTDSTPQLEAILTRLEKLMLDAVSSKKANSRSGQSREGRNRDRSRPGSQRSRQSSPWDTEQPPEGICWYHWRFGARARKCTAPCSGAVQEISE